jgi:hypothetical protein
MAAYIPMVFPAAYLLDVKGISRHTGSATATTAGSLAMM